MPNNDNIVNRESAILDLYKRFYANKEGGTYDAKDAGVRELSTYDAQGENVSINATNHDKTPKFVTKQQLGVSNFAGVKDDGGNFATEKLTSNVPQ